MIHTRSVVLTRGFPVEVIRNAFALSGAELQSSATFENSDRVIVTVSGKAEQIMTFYSKVLTHH